MYVRYVLGSSGQSVVTGHPHLVDKLDFKLVAQREALFTKLKAIEVDMVIFSFQISAMFIKYKNQLEY